MLCNEHEKYLAGMSDAAQLHLHVLFGKQVKATTSTLSWVHNEKTTHFMYSAACFESPKL